MNTYTLGGVAKQPTVIDQQPSSGDIKANVLHGLRQPQKWISSMYFYDARGSALFDAICELPEYYLTRTEIAIMETSVDSIATALGSGISLIEFGSGASAKTRLLLNRLDAPAIYIPVDISREQLAASADELQALYPDVAVQPLCADFTAPFDLPTGPQTASRNVVYFPGSTIGNFGPPEALEILRQMRKISGPNGATLIGVDITKDPTIVQRAYNDSAGVTATFNKNILARLNRDIEADFHLDAFAHRALWNSTEGRVEMHLVSLCQQTVHIGGDVIHLRKDETIHTESSYKYELYEFSSLARQAGYSVDQVWTDPAQLFSVQYLLASA